jgi:hypothetical protein
MHSMDIMYHNNIDTKHPNPEAFDVHHNGSFSGDIKICLEDYRVKTIHEADSQWARHGQAIVEITIPFEVIAEVVAEAVRRRVIANTQNADWAEVLGLRH